MGGHPGVGVLASVVDNQRGVAEASELVKMEHSEKSSLSKVPSIPSFQPSESQED